MSRTNELTQATTVLKDLKNLEDLKLIKDPSSLSITTINVNINFASPTSSASSEEYQKTLTKICSLIGHQLHESREEKKQREERRTRRAVSREQSHFSAEMDSTQVETTEQENEEALSKLTKIPKSKMSAEYQDLSHIGSALSESHPRRVKYRIVPAKDVKAIPEDQLPKKKFAGDLRKRREYVQLGDLNKVEAYEVTSPEVRAAERAERKKKSREAANELY